MSEIEQKLNLVEDTSTANAPNIATTDENISVSQMFQQNQIPSLGRKIFSVVPIHGPTAALFNLRKNAAANKFELVREEVEVYPSTSISTGLTQEVVQDVFNQYGKYTSEIVGKLLRGLANNQENTKTLEFLEDESLAYANLQLSTPMNAETNLFEISQRVQEIVLKINSKNIRSFDAFAVIPHIPLGGVMALRSYAQGEDFDEFGLFIAKINGTKYYFNPDPDSTRAYVGLKDSQNPSCSSAVFSPYAEDVTMATDPDTGEQNYFIFNRYAITASPLHKTNDEMLYKFDILV